jgi:hypothetical protein
MIMSDTINPRLPRIVKIILDIIFGFLVFASIFLVLWIAFSPLILRVTDIPITSSVPVAIGLGDDPTYEVDLAGAEAKGIRAAYVEGAQGTLRLETTDWYLIFISNLGKLLIALGLVFVVYLLRAVLQAILQGDIFTRENAKQIRRIGYAVLIVGFVQAFAEYFAAREILRQVMIVDPPFGLPSPFEPEVILASLLILVLAQVWSYGLELERERALTI